jgi:hypothetical protein
MERVAGFASPLVVARVRRSSKKSIENQIDNYQSLSYRFSKSTHPAKRLRENRPVGGGLMLPRTCGIVNPPSAGFFFFGVVQ